MPGQKRTQADVLDQENQPAFGYPAAKGGLPKAHGANDRQVLREQNGAPAVGAGGAAGLKSRKGTGAEGLRLADPSKSKKVQKSRVQPSKTSRSRSKRSGPSGGPSGADKENGGLGDPEARAKEEERKQRKEQQSQKRLERISQREKKQDQIWFKQKIYQVPAKPACGIDNPYVPTPKCDREHLTDPDWFVHYVKGVHRYHKRIEGGYVLNSARFPAWDSVDDDYRAIVVDWMIEAQNKCKMSEESLYLAVNLMDRYIGRRLATEKELMLVAVTSLFLGAKFEEIWPPEVNDLVWMTKNKVTRNEVLDKEVEILNRLQFNLTFPTPYTFMLRYAKAVGLQDKHVVFCQYLMELLMPSKKFSTYESSRIAAAALHLTCRTFKADLVAANVRIPSRAEPEVKEPPAKRPRRPVSPEDEEMKDASSSSSSGAATEEPRNWGEWLQRLTGWERADLMDIENQMSSLLRNVSMVTENNLKQLKAVKKKFMDEKYHKWADLAWS
uniref:Uncharacterized protein n=1 Tax=Chromera velia CCMP2878 TaxID=1169474 RepID=A0A0G4I227_9ALVE|eukprot:Cvel_10303.t1-p1 / transcript=Cvel_10303.t1 / gene=Cvel_10303 / organism=Chromera_velia_CCMP2878 / gene_product=G2/mitotic-specific cyclin-B, putative / transcript_product=G2/mitotic-specific cyclin-B, putative / location=Cvel_scaffold618:47050-50964(+) / protein_length=497 / sequence_SO=supercontig / SO=protein_coding / is_pseudo=false